MKRIIVLNTSYRKEGNGQALAEGFLRRIHSADPEIEVKEFRLGELKIGFCRGCYGCRRDGVCVQKDDFAEILKAGHEADGVLVISPVYYNLPAAPLITVIDRLCCT
ncbi:MAG: flavodoxin family protein, partial [Bulleidia sp.]